VSDSSQDQRLTRIVDLVLEVAEGNYAGRIEPSDAGDDIDAVIVGLNLFAESLELERDRRRRAEALLRDEIHGYEEAPAMFCSLDARLDIVKCNETLARALGCPKAELLDRRFLGFVAADDRGAAQEALGEIRSGQTPERSTFHLQPPGGKRIPVLLSGSPTADATGRIRLTSPWSVRSKPSCARPRSSRPSGASPAASPTTSTTSSLSSSVHRPCSRSTSRKITAACAS